MSAANKAVVRQWFANFSSGDLAAQTALLGSGHQYHFPFVPVPLDGPAHMAAQQGFQAAIPDLQFTLHEQLADGDKVVTRFTFTGTFKNAFMGMPPTGGAIACNGINIMHIVDGKNAEEWDAFDTLTLMRQFGAVPTPEDG
ncbi:MAG: ester cyclase [Candidatus Latescibacteria bacterium]|nr:ester cyclase [Candidatus Latescibacterota bacterium]